MYERPINPPEPILADLTVNFEVYVLLGYADVITREIGGESSVAGALTDENGTRWDRVIGSTLVEDAEDYDSAEEIVTNLFIEHLSNVVDTDNLIITADRIEDDGPDWDAIAKDERAEAAIDW